MFVKKTIKLISRSHELQRMLLTTTMEVQFHKGYRTMYSVIIRIFVAEFSNPRKVCLVQVFLETSNPVVEHRLRVIFVEGYKEAYDSLLLVWREFRDWAALCACCEHRVWVSSVVTHRKEQLCCLASHHQDVSHQKDSTYQPANSFYPYPYST